MSTPAAPATSAAGRFNYVSYCALLSGQLAAISDALGLSKGKQSAGFDEIMSSLAALREQLEQWKSSADSWKRKCEEVALKNATAQKEASEAQAAVRQMREAGERLVDYCIENPQNVVEIPHDVWTPFTTSLAIQHASALNAVIEAATAEQDLPSAETPSVDERQGKETDGAQQFVIEIPLFMLWESARPHCLTSDDWPRAFVALQEELKRETDEQGSNRVYEMLEGCVERLTQGGYLRDMTGSEIESDAPCPFYE